MKVIRIHEFGGVDKLLVDEVEKPNPAEGEVLIRMEAAGISYADTMLRENKYLFTPELPFTMGFEIAGTIEETGKGVENFKTGDRVLAMNRGGGYAEYSVADAKSLLPIPTELSAAEATALLMQGLTAFGLLQNLNSGQCVLIHEAAVGAGPLLVRLAKLKGARVLGTATTKANLKKIGNLGADGAIDIRDGRWTQQVLDSTYGQGADLIIVMINDRMERRNIKCLASNGEMIIYGTASKADFQISAFGPIDEQQTVREYDFSLETLQNIAKLTDELMDHYRVGHLEVPVTEFPLEKASEAHSAIEKGETTGKVVLIASQVKQPEVFRLTDPGAGRIEGLDGLRAFAVLVVLAYHLWPSIAPGGFLGVDVFFVISGFLITTLLLRERNKKGRINLTGFWKRRARRLIPALLLVVATSVAAARVVSTDLLVNIRRQVLGALTFSTNWVEIFAGADYFAETERSLFVPFWSLAVEEQFYLFWPLILIGLLALTTVPSRLMWAAIGAAAGSALLMAFLFDPTLSATRVYYGTDTHSFGLMIGVALAFAFAGPARIFETRLWQKLRLSLGILAMFGLTILVFAVDSEAASTYRGGILLASLLSAIAIAVLPGSPTGFTSFCRLGPLVWVGERSYGMYLWHWPVLLIVGAAINLGSVSSAPGWATVIIVIVVTFALTEASYRWVEAPIRKKGFRGTWATIRTAFRRPLRELHWPAIKVSGAGLIIGAALFGFLTAPDKSQAQMSVEAGERAIAAQLVQSIPTPTDEKQVAEAAEPGEAQGTEPGAAWPRDLPVPPGDYIVGLGDSVLSAAAPAIYKKFPGVYLDARPSLQWHDVPAIVRQMISKGTMRSVVILNFGTNAGFKYPESEKAFREVLRLLGPDRRVVLITVVGVSYWVPETNATLHEISNQYPNTVVADWDVVTRERPELLYRDRTHPNDPGTEVLADLLADKLQSLGPG